MPELFAKLHRYQHPAVFFANGIGDILLNLPALRALASLLPARLALISPRGAHTLCLSELPLRVLVEPRFWDAEGNRHFCVADTINGLKKCDLLLSLVPWYSSSLQELLDHFASAVSVGFNPAYTVPIACDYSKHSMDLAFDIPKHLSPSLTMEAYTAPPQFPLQARRKAEELYHLVPSTKRVLVVHADTLAAKMWTTTKFVDVLDSFLEQHSDFIVMVVGYRPQPLDRGKYGSRVLLCYDLSLAVCMCIVSMADMFLGVDSCMLHVADLCRVPGVGLFGPKPNDAFGSREFGFRLATHRHVEGGGSMASIEVEAVVDALETLFCETQLNGDQPVRRPTTFHSDQVPIL